MSHCREKLAPDMSHVLKAVFTGGTQAPRTGCWPQCLHVCICEGCILTLVFHQQIPLVALRSSCLWDGPPTLALSAELMALNSLFLLHCFSWGCLTHRRTHACTRTHSMYVPVQTHTQGPQGLHACDLQQHQACYLLMNLQWMCLFYQLELYSATQLPG